MIKKIAVVLGVILAIFVSIAALTPEEYMIKREIVINAKPEDIFPNLVSAKNTDKWMPWRETDSQVQMAYAGPEEGVGSISKWESPGQMGTGMAEIISVNPNQLVKTKITYTKPMEMSQESEFELTPVGENTLMTWKVSGKQPFIPRLICVLMFMNMDKYVGGMFEKGLKDLKTIVEAK